MLKHYGVKPFVVFDGGHLPAKKGTEEERKKRRDEHRQQAMKMLAQGRQKQAFEHFTKCVDVTPAMAYQLIRRLREQDIDYIVAPYEADAQLAYLEKRGVIEGIITEDSDLLVFGCQRVLYKLSPEGNCVEVRQSEKARCRSLPFAAFPDELFRQMAILSGCDYLESVPGMGLKTAHKLLKRFKTVSKALSAARMDGMKVPTTYEEDFERAEKTFVYQRVFDRDEEGVFRLVTLTPASTYDGNLKADDCIGAELPEHLAKGIARGDIDPITHLPIENLLTRVSSSSVAGVRSSKVFSSSSTKRTMSAPSRLNKQVKPEAGQRGIKGFFATAKADSPPAKITDPCPFASQQSPSRIPLASKSLNQSSAQQESHGGVVEGETSKFFGTSFPSAKEATTPRSKRQRTESMTSAGSVSSPASSSQVSPQAQKLQDLLSSDPANGESDLEDGDDDDDENRFTSVSLEWKSKFAFSPQSMQTPRSKIVRATDSVKRRRSNGMGVEDKRSENGSLSVSKRAIAVAAAAEEEGEDGNYFSSARANRWTESTATPSFTMGRLQIDSATIQPRSRSSPLSEAVPPISVDQPRAIAVRPSLESFRCPRGRS